MEYHNPDSITVYVVCAYSGYGTVCIVGFIEPCTACFGNTVLFIGDINKAT